MCFRTQTEGETCLSGRLLLPSFLLETPFSPSPPLVQLQYCSPGPLDSLAGCIALQSFLLCVCLPPIFLLLRFWQPLLLFPRDGCGIASGDICACDLLTQPRKRENSTLQRWGWGVLSAGLGRQRNGCGEGIQLLWAYRVTLPSHQLKEIERAAAAAAAAIFIN